MRLILSKQVRITVSDEANLPRIYVLYCTYLVKTGAKSYGKELYTSRRVDYFRSYQRVLTARQYISTTEVERQKYFEIKYFAKFNLR